ncbi:MAG TPA: hypothetical protein IAB61_12520 [Candidatus Merdisoma merdipullorum]|nr:hypothetical protein [Candidatus Merdisoma merdipullorum]
MLFDVVPDNFFGPLAAPGKLVYWECICRLFSVTSRQLSFGVERDVLVDELQYYFESAMSADIPEEELEDAGSMTSRDKANFMLRRLESYGWIYIDVDYSYVQRVNFRDYAIQVIKALLAVSEERRAEYQGYIYTIYNLARAGGTNPGLGLLQIAENMDALITGLKSLNANIKRYIDELTKHSTVAEIMDALLNDYYTNVVDKAYHRLLTSDNVAKFRPEIIEQLEANSRSRRFLNAASKEIAELKELTPEEADELVLELLHEVIDAFRSMDEILDEINKKNTRYQRAAINRARFLLSSSEDIRGQLKDILIFMNERIQEQNIDYNAIYELEETDRLIRIFYWDYLNTDSLYAPVEGKKEFVPQEIPDEIPDEKAREEKRRKMLLKLERTLSPDKIDACVREWLGDRKRMLASELPLSEDDTFIKLIYIRLYGQRKRMGYRLEMKDTVEREGFRFRDFEMIWKERQRDE